MSTVIIISGNYALSLEVKKLEQYYYFGLLKKNEKLTESMI